MNSQQPQPQHQPQRHSPQIAAHEDERTELVDVEALRRGAAAYEEAQEGEKTAMVDVSAFRQHLEQPEGFAPDLPRIPPSRPSGRHAYPQTPAPPSNSFAETPMMPGDSGFDAEENTAFIDFGALPPSQYAAPNPHARTEAMPPIQGAFLEPQHALPPHPNARTEAMSSIPVRAGRTETFAMDTHDVEFIEEDPLPSIMVGEGMNQPGSFEHTAKTQSFALPAFPGGNGPLSGMPQRGAPSLGHAGAAGMPHTPGGTLPPDQDALLRGAYHFEPHQVHQMGEITLLRAKNAQGAEVVVRQIWNHAPDLMPQALHEQVGVLGAIDSPALLKMHGMFTSHSGRWIEFEAPKGETLVQRVQRQGALPPEEVKWWLQDVAVALDAIHAQGLVYLNLTPDAIWLHEPTKQVYLEPFGLFALKDRGNLGPFGAQELHRTGTHDPSQGSDHYSLAMVILYALTGQTDQAAVAKLEKAPRAALTKALHPSPGKRAKSALNLIQTAKLMRAAEKINFLDKRILLPVTALVVAVTLGGTLLVDTSPPAPYTQVNFKKVEGADKQPVATPPGAVKELKDVKVVKSFATLPPKEADQQTDTKDPAKAAAALEKGLEALKNPDPNPATVLGFYAEAVRAGASKEGEKELLEAIRNNTEVFDHYKKELISFEERLGAQKKIDASLQREYANLAKIVPGAKHYSFLSRNRVAPIKKISATSPPSTKTKE